MVKQPDKAGCKTVVATVGCMHLVFDVSLQQPYVQLTNWLQDPARFAACAVVLRRAEHMCVPENSGAGP